MICLNNISVKFEEKQVLENFSLELPEKGILCLSGPSGCGKTTLARVLCFLQKPDAGCVSGLHPGTIAMLFQEDRLLPWLNVKKNLELVMSAQQAEAILKEMELLQECDSFPNQLSGGMQRRVALARALGYPSELLILDEPFKGMDLALRRRIYPVIRKAAETRPVLLITHETEDIEALADAVLSLDGPPLRIEK